MWRPFPWPSNNLTPRPSSFHSSGLVGKKRESLTLYKQTPPWPSVIARLSVSHPNLISFNRTLVEWVAQPPIILSSSPGVMLKQCWHLSPARTRMSMQPWVASSHESQFWAEEGLRNQMEARFCVFWGKINDFCSNYFCTLLDNWTPVKRSPTSHR